VSATCREGVVCVGGGDAARNSADVFRLEWKDGRLVTTPLPPLPRPVANACGALVGGSLYIAGGQETPDAVTTLKTVYRADLSAETPAWTEIESWPGPARMLATAAACDGKFWLVGGVSLVKSADGTATRKYLRDAYYYDPAVGWERIADLPVPLAACPSPAPVDGSGFDLLGGDDGSQVGVAPDRHRGFRADILRFDAASKAWTEAGTLPAPRVTTPCVPWDEAWVIPSGEARPGVRSPEVWRFRPEPKESPRRGR
jgi:N-acetylneuraminic acid mutarotase